MKLLCVIVCVLGLVACSSSPVKEEPLVQAKKVDTTIAMLEKLKKRPNAKVLTQEGWTIVLLGTSMWSFTPEDHPDHPSAVKRTIVAANEELKFRTKTYCSNENVNCDHLLVEVERISRNLPKQAITQR